MNIEVMITILIILLLGIIFLKAIRKILSILFCLVILYCIFYTFFTYNGAVKFGVFRETNEINSYKIDIEEVKNEDKKFTRYYKIKGDLKKDISIIGCKSYGPVIFCEEYRK